MPFTKRDFRSQQKKTQMILNDKYYKKKPMKIPFDHLYIYAIAWDYTQRTTNHI